MNDIKRGEIYFADLSPIVGSEQDGLRPVIILQNNMGNKHSPTTIVAAITSKKTKTEMLTHVEIKVDKLRFMFEDYALLPHTLSIEEEKALIAKMERQAEMAEALGWDEEDI